MIIFTLKKPYLFPYLPFIHCYVRNFGVLCIFHWVNVLSFSDTWAILFFDLLVTLLLTLNRFLTAEMIFSSSKRFCSSQILVKFDYIFPYLPIGIDTSCFHLAYSFIISQWMLFLYQLYMFNGKSIMHFTLHFHRLEIMNTFEQLGLQDSKGYFTNELCTKFDLSVRPHIYTIQVYWFLFCFCLPTHF